MAVTPLILAGGKSTRMKSPKHLLLMPDGRPLYQHQIDVLRQACPESSIIYLSLAQDSRLDDFLRECAAARPNDERRPSNVRVIPDTTSNESAESAGPAAGLLAAFAAYPRTTWLVVPCDAPFLTTEVLKRQLQEYAPPVTCYRNSKGFCEPIIGIWSPDALARLAETAKGGKAGPSSVVRELGGKQIELPVEAERPLTDVNTRQEWEEALVVLNASGSTVYGEYI